MANHIFLSTLDHLIMSRAAADQAPAHINRLRLSATAARDVVDTSLASLQSSLLLLGEIERLYSLPPTALVIAPGGGGERGKGRGERREGRPRPPHPRWDVYPAFPKAIRLGEIEAADEREAIEKAVKKFEQDPAMLIVVRRG